MTVYVGAHEVDTMINGGSGDRPLALVAEDEAVSRMALVSLLRDAGYATIEATSGPGAMRALEERAGVCLVLTDIDMTAGFDGITLAACVNKRWPGVGIILVSGKIIPRLGDVPTGARFLPKPYEETEMLAAIGLVVRSKQSPLIHSPVPV